jgi:hypothetical protein
MSTQNIYLLSIDGEPTSAYESEDEAKASVARIITGRMEEPISYVRPSVSSGSIVVTRLTLVHKTRKRGA